MVFGNRAGGFLAFLEGVLPSWKAMGCARIETLVKIAVYSLDVFVPAAISVQGTLLSALALDFAMLR